MVRLVDNKSQQLGQYMYVSYSYRILEVKRNGCIMHSIKICDYKQVCNKVQMQTEDGGGGAEENVLFRTSIHGWAGVIRTSVSQ